MRLHEFVHTSMQEGVAEGTMKDLDIDLQDQQWDSVVGYVINGLNKGMDTDRMELALYKWAGRELYDVDQALEDHGFRDIADLADHIQQHHGRYVPPTDFGLGELEEDLPTWIGTGIGAAALATGMAHRQGPAYDKPQPYVAPVAQVAPAQRPQTAPATIPQAKSAPTVKTEPAKVEPKPQVKNKPITLENPKANVLAQRAQKSGIKGIELAQFLAQMEHESWDFKKMKEVPQGKDYFKRYDPKTAPKTAQKLGNVRPGDGERFKGRGFIQLTGRDNYRAASQALGIDLIKNPDLAARPDIAAEIAIWYWFERVRPGVMDFANTVAVTRRINPALAGIEDRHENFKYYLKYMR